jgi:hypothetical protein
LNLTHQAPPQETTSLSKGGGGAGGGPELPPLELPQRQQRVLDQVGTAGTMGEVERAVHVFEARRRRKLCRVTIQECGRLLARFGKSSEITAKNMVDREAQRIQVLSDLQGYIDE